MHTMQKFALTAVLVASVAALTFVGSEAAFADTSTTYCAPGEAPGHLDSTGHTSNCQCPPGTYPGWEIAYNTFASCLSATVNTPVLTASPAARPLAVAPPRPAPAAVAAPPAVAPAVVPQAAPRAVAPAATPTATVAASAPVIAPAAPVQIPSALVSEWQRMQHRVF
jgi:hypothetical protein